MTSINEVEKDLTAAFNKAQEALPYLTAGTVPLAKGSFGLIISHDDNSLTKIFFRQYQKEWRRSAEISFANEIYALQTFAAHPITDIQTPVLIGKPKKLSHKNYMGAYSMTRIAGGPYLSFTPQNNNPAKAKLINKNAGQALAKFHRATRDISFEQPYKTENHQNDTIRQVDILGGATNRALAKADDYLRTHIQGGIIHGDYHGGNVIMDESCNVTGLIDFSNTGYNPNMYLDFTGAPQAYLDDFIQGYEEESESDIIIDPHMVTASALAGWANYLNKIQYSSFSRTEAITKINGYLHDMASITGV